MLNNSVSAELDQREQQSWADGQTFRTSEVDQRQESRCLEQSSKSRRRRRATCSAPSKLKQQESNRLNLNSSSSRNTSVKDTQQLNTLVGFISTDVVYVASRQNCSDSGGDVCLVWPSPVFQAAGCWSCVVSLPCAPSLIKWDTPLLCLCLTSSLKHVDMNTCWRQKIHSYYFLCGLMFSYIMVIGQTGTLFVGICWQGSRNMFMSSDRFLMSVDQLSR